MNRFTQSQAYVPDEAGALPGPTRAQQSPRSTHARRKFFCVATLFAAAIATSAPSSASPGNAQSPIAAAIIAPTSPVISADDLCGDGWEWSKTIGACIPVPTRAPTPPPGATYQCVDGTYSFSKTPKGACSHHSGIDHPV